MRTKQWVGVAGTALLGMTLWAAACSDWLDLAGDCTFTGACCADGTLNCLKGDGATPPGCVPSLATGAVADICGVFVSPSGDDANAGTKEKPLKTITAALDKGAAVYVCAAPMPYAEALMVSRPVVLYGALDCTSWVYGAATKTQLTGPSDAVPLTLTSTASGTTVEDFTITAADATKAGGSSIAVLIDHAGLLLENVDVNAGSGAAGGAGEAQAQVMTPSMAKGGDGTDDAACNVTTPIAGGAGGMNTCGTTDTSGGLGGDGAAASTGGNGNPGNPMMTPSNAGSAQTAMASCNPGGKGMDGNIGMSGTGARGAGDVSASGFHGPMGMTGMSGTAGQGGGGGGGARQCSPGNAGPSGGGGGAGGCPGAPGNAGQSGGSSIGVLAIGAQVTLKSSSITTRSGGVGGTGGDGQMGGNGGLPGDAIGGAACGGGKGGQGGAGGPGGGGAGGHSVAVAIKGGALPDLSTTTIIMGTAGNGGLGGDMDMTAQTKGDGGLACNTLDFTNTASPACGM